jgi:hypothetical protein
MKRVFILLFQGFIRLCLFVGAAGCFESEERRWIALVIFMFWVDSFLMGYAAYAADINNIMKSRETKFSYLVDNIFTLSFITILIAYGCYCTAWAQFLKLFALDAYYKRIYEYNLTTKVTAAINGEKA